MRPAHGLLAGPSVAVNGFLNSGLSAGELLLLLAGIVAAVIAIKFTVSFDLNRHLEGRRSRYSQKLKNACPHIRVVQGADGRLALQSEFVSPPGTTMWICQRCGLGKYLYDDDVEQQMIFYASHLELLRKRNKEFYRLLKKSGQV